jgi:hypothetical protein
MAKGKTKMEQKRYNGSGLSRTGSVCIILLKQWMESRCGPSTTEPSSLALHRHFIVQFSGGNINDREKK